MKRERRKFTNEFKAEVALEAIKEKLTMVELAMKYKVNPVQIKAGKYYSEPLVIENVEYFLKKQH